MSVGSDKGRSKGRVGSGNVRGRLWPSSDKLLPTTREVFYQRTYGIKDALQFLHVIHEWIDIVTI